MVILIVHGLRVEVSWSPEAEDRAEQPSQAVAVGGADDGHGQVLGRCRHEVVVGDGQSVGLHLLARGQLTDRDGADAAGSRGRELAIHLRVVLAVVTDEQPLDVRELPGQPMQRGPLVLLPGPEPAGVRGTVREERGPDG